MDFGLWKEPKVIVASILLFAVTRMIYKKNRLTGRPRVVSYLVPWVGSAVELGKNPDAFFRRAMYVPPYSFGAGDESLLSSATHGDMFTVKTFGRTITYITSPHVRNTGSYPTMMRVG